MAKEFLYRPDIVAILEQVRCKAMPQRVTGASLRDTRFDDRLLDGSLDRTLMKVMTPLDGAARVN